MKRNFCDRCGIEIPTKTKKNFLGIVPYNLTNNYYYLNWKTQYEICEECKKSFIKWFKERCLEK